MPSVGDAGGPGTGAPVADRREQVGVPLSARSPRRHLHAGVAVVGAESGRTGGDGPPAGQRPDQAAVGVSVQAPARRLVGEPVVVLAEAGQVVVRRVSLRMGNLMVEVAASGAQPATGE